MKHHNKFDVQTYNAPNKYKITFAELGRVESGIVSGQIVTIDEVTLEDLLNAVYDEAYERGRNAVRVCMNEAMGFDGE